MAATSRYVEVLHSQEEELVSVLSEKDPVEVATNLFKKNIISDTMRDQFASLDHSRVETQLQIRYLLRLVCKRLEEGNTVWDTFYTLLISMGTKFSIVTKGLQELLNKNASAVSQTTNTSGTDDSNIILYVKDAEDITELLAEIPHRWEVIAIALKLSAAARAKCRSSSDDDVIHLNEVITYWLSGNTEIPATLHALRKALCSPIVNESNVGMALEEKIRPVLRARQILADASEMDSSSCNLNITNQSNDTEVADGKSTLLLCQASPRGSVSHQWKKNGQPLSNSSKYSGVNDDILIISQVRQGFEGEYTCHVSSEGKEKCSNKIILTVQHSAIKKRLLDLYFNNCEVPSDSWPPSGTRTFINLVLSKSSTKRTAVADYSVRGNPDETIADQEKVKYEDIFGECRRGELILLEGRPGSGKTTLVHKLIKDWTLGRVLVNARWVMLITIRNLNNSKAESLTDILQRFCHSDEINKSIERESGEGLCFVIDGLDEYKHQDKEATPIYQLLNRTLLPKATIILSSRPVTTKNLKQEKVTKRIEVFGFNKWNIFEYIDCYPFDGNYSCSDTLNTSSSYPEKLKEYLHTHPNVLHLCYLPVNAAIICSLFNLSEGYIPTTRTKIYEEFTRSIILRHLRRYNPSTTLNSLNNLSGEHKTNFLSLCQLAFQMTVSKKQIITPQDANIKQTEKENSRFFGLVTLSITTKLSGFHSTYSFLHLTFQEFFAAMYVSSLDIADQVRIIEEHPYYTAQSMWRFYSGLVNFSEGMERLKMLLSSHHTNKTIIAFESQQCAVVDYVCRYNNGRIKIYDSTPTDISALDYFLDTVSLPITHILIHTSCGDYDYMMLLNILQQYKRKLHQLDQLNISHPSLNEAHVKVLADTLDACTKLRRSELSIKNINYNSMNCLFQKLGSLLHLEMIKFLCSRNEASDIMALFSSYKCAPLIKSKISIHLVFKDLDTSSIVELGGQFQQVGTNRITNLYLLQCSTKADGASVLASGLPSLTKLSVLALPGNDLSEKLSVLALPGNDLSDDEVIELCGGIKHLHSLSTLNLSYNNLSPSCITNLVSGTSCLPSLHCLDLSHNKFGLTGAIRLASELHHLENLRSLSLSGNNIDAAGVITIITALKNCTQLGTVNINNKWYSDRWGLHTIYVKGLVSPNDVDTIAALTAAARGTQFRYLHLGCTKIDIQQTQKCHLL